MHYQILVTIACLVAAIAGCDQAQPKNTGIRPAGNQVQANAPVRQIDDATFNAELDPSDDAGFSGTHPDSELPKKYRSRPKVEHSRGFFTLLEGNLFRQFWEKQEPRNKMHGEVSDHLTREQIDAIIMLEVNIAIAVSPHSPSLQDELLRFMIKGNRFETGRLPDSFDKSPRKHLVAVIRMKTGAYGLITLYRDFAVIEMNGLVGLAPAAIDNASLPAGEANNADGACVLEIVRGGGLPPPNASGAEFEHYSLKVAKDGSWEYRYGVFTKGGIKKGKLSIEELQRWIKDIESGGFHKLNSNPHLGKADEGFLDISIRGEREKVQKRIDLGEKLSQAVHKKVVELTKPFVSSEDTGEFDGAAVTSPTTPEEVRKSFYEQAHKRGLLQGRPKEWWTRLAETGEQWHVRKQPYARALERVDGTLREGEMDAIVFGTLDDLRKDGECWHVEDLHGFFGVIALPGCEVWEACLSLAASRRLTASGTRAIAR